ncbi:hypothetical protein PAXRUDRAFT_373090 [Paxillus rubicundulus Ve08.2h10]|uniref:Uncharacterized protein n=1 Tax=Paxillus rubicundulus Ve08.2h10 TaxID=930991 RepID=A0A0D0DRH4_9AGAM|nr:hypothetical protein PAXRUDRAFT_373090 [Paxillus rubicundulus Ve08.2h10]
MCWLCLVTIYDIFFYLVLYHPLLCFHVQIGLCCRFSLCTPWFPAHALISFPTMIRLKNTF